MSIVAATCTNCGANVNVESTKDAAICQYCGTPFIVEKAIHNYQVMNNISGSVVNIYGNNPRDFEIRAGTLVKYNGASTQVEIPNEIVIIGANAFSNCKALASTSFPNGLKEIESGAFSGCVSLSNISLPNGLTIIGDYAFSHCSSLTSVELPAGLTEIGDKAFGMCTSLKSINIPDSMFHSIVENHKGQPFKQPFKGSAIEKLQASQLIFGEISRFSSRNHDDNCFIIPYKRECYMSGTPYGERLRVGYRELLDRQGVCWMCGGKLYSSKKDALKCLNPYCQSNQSRF